MTAHTISSNTVLFFSVEELEEKGMPLPQLTYRQTLSLVHPVFELSGQMIPMQPDIEVFTTSDGILIFIRPLCSEAPQFTQTHCISS